MPVSHDRVWASIADLGSHTRWMRDARSIVFVGDQKQGKGTRMQVRTVVGPLRTTDEMEVMDWDEGHSIEVAHRGLVKGRGRLAVEGQGSTTVVSWDEILTFPWWLGGSLTAWLARPILTTVWKSNLERLEETLTDP